MPIKKNYDEMADRYQYVGDSYQVINDKNGFGEVWLSVAYVDLKQGTDTFWLMAVRKGSDWYWLDDTSFILLVDGQRFTGVGAVRDSEVLQEAGFFETKTVCYEEIHCGGDFGILQIIAQGQSAKFRLGDVDFVLPSELVSDAKEILADIVSTGGHGAN
jgi:hypothetical protein